jgi:hypothetical protein
MYPSPIIQENTPVKSSLFFLLICTNLLCSHSLYAKGKTPPRSGNALAAGSTGSFTPAYASSATTASASFGVTPVAINFLNNLTTSTGITHPVAGNFAQFQVANSGVYQLFWTINVLWPQSGMNAFTTVVVDLIKAEPLPTVSLVTIQNNEAGNANAQVFGQMIVPLQAGETLSLQIFNNEGETLEISPSSIFSICQLTP